MRKLFWSFMIWNLLSISINAYPTQAISQVTALKNGQVKLSGAGSKRILLSEALNLVKVKYDVDIMCEARTIQSIRVEKKDLDASQSIEGYFQKVLPQNGLRFKKINAKQYLIFPESKNKSSNVSTSDAVNQLFTSVHHAMYNNSSIEENTNRKIQGRVLDENGEGLPSVSILIKGTQEGTITDIEGNFELATPEEATLVISSIGYLTQEIVLSAQVEYQITLKSDLKTLEEVVVVGYGTQKKVNLTGAVSTVSAKQLENRAVTRVDEALQGEAPGLRVVKMGGQPGKNNIAMQIRGTSTFTNNPVLTIIDGLPSSIDRINPNDIETISVLKDAASTAIYGARAAGGVILITTKSGKEGKTQINYDAYVGMQEATRLPQKVSAFQHALNFREAQLNDNPATTVFQFSEDDLARFSSPDWKDYNRYDVILRKAVQMQQNVGISGGNEKQNYFLSLGYLRQEGIVMNTDFKRYNMQYNQNIQLSKKLRLGFRGSYIPSQTIAPSEVNYSGGPARGLNNLISWGLYRRGNHLPIYAGEGKWSTVEGVENIIGLSSEEGGQQRLKSNQVIGNFSLDYQITPHLKASALYGINYTQSRQRDYSTKMKFYNPNDPDLVGAEVRQNALLIQNSSESFQSSKFLLNYARTFQKHDFSILGGYTREESYMDNESVGRRDFLTDNIYAINAGSTDPSTWTSQGASSDWALSSFIGRATYNYNNKYLAEASMRYDGSSRFVKDTRWGLFPSFSLGWRIIEEDFLKDSKVLNDLKIRASWGQVGNQNVGNYPFASTLGISTYYFNGLPQRGVFYSGAPNRELTWETKTATNIGIDGSLFNNMLSFTIDIFKERTKDILLTVPLPTTYGLNAPVQNTGIVDNRGWEFQISHQNTMGKLKYGLSFQVSDATEKVVDLAGTGPWISGNTITEEGYTMNEWYGWRSEGLFQTTEEVNNHSFQNPKTSPGDIKYQENGGDPSTITPDDRVRLGRSSPRFPFGLRINLSYSNFDFIAFGQGVMSHTTWNNGWTAYNFDRAQSTIFDYHLDRWTPETPNARYPKPRIGGINAQFSSFWLENAAYFRMKNIQLGYNVSKKALEKLKIAKLRLYLSSENLFTITKVKGFDPEITTGTASRLVEYRYPLSKVFNFGVNVSF